jgi:hypothetical protein
MLRRAGRGEKAATGVFSSETEAHKTSLKEVALQYAH